MGISWEELREQILTKEERQELSDKVRLVGALIEARREREMTQQKLGEAVGVRQPFIANIENGRKDPSVSMLLKILHALGKTLAVVDIKKSKTV
ncbi:MAG: helix-turn-helix transcriptional regulator [Alphaproteobacteria bacterium]|nr:helix-turn-helix transcriptional regulator [Alphaproteobacteria bacterium]